MPVCNLAHHGSSLSNDRSTKLRIYLIPATSSRWSDFTRLANLLSLYKFTVPGANRRESLPPRLWSFCYPDKCIPFWVEKTQKCSAGPDGFLFHLLCQLLQRASWILLVICSCCIRHDYTRLLELLPSKNRGPQCAFLHAIKYSSVSLCIF